MSVLDSSIGLIFSIKGDSTDARADLEKFSKDVDKHSKDIETAGGNSFHRFAQSIGLSTEQTAKLSAALPVVGAALASTAAVVLGTGAALFSLTKSAADAGTEIYNFTQLSGLSAEAVSTIKIASDAAGLSLENFEEVWESFIETILEGGQGAEDASEKLKKAGIDPQQGFKDLEGSVKKAFDAVRNAKSDAEAASIAMAVFGESGLGMVKVARSMTGGFEEFQKKLKETGATFDTEGAAKAKEFNRELGFLGLQANGVKNAFAKEMMPGIVSAMKEISRVLTENKADVKAWASAVGTFVGESARFIKGLERSWQLAKYAFDVYTQGTAGAQAPKFLATPERIVDPRAGVEIEDPDAASNSNFLKTEEARKKAADAAQKAEAEQLAAREKFNSASKESFKQSFDELQRITVENYKNQITGAEKFHSDFEENERQFRTKLIQLTSDGFDIQISREKNKTAQNALRTEQRTEIEKIIADSTRRIDDAEKIVTETRRKDSDERVKNTKESLEREIALRESVNKTINARLDADVVSGALSPDAANESRKILLNQLVDLKRANLAKELELVKGNAQEEEKVRQKQKEFEAELERQGYENFVAAANKKKEATLELLALQREVVQTERAILDFRAQQERKTLENTAESSRGKARIDALVVLRQFDIEEARRHREIAEEDAQIERDAAKARITDKIAEKEKLEEIEKLYQDRLLISKEEFEAKKKEIENSYKTPIGEAGADSVGGGILTGALDGLGISLEQLSKPMDTMHQIGETLAGSFNQIAQGVGNAVKSFVLFGSAGGSFKKFAAEVLASIAQMAVVQAVFELAQGFAMLALAYFGHPSAGPSATQHFIAAGVFGAIGGVAAIAGRAVAGNSFKQQTSTGGSGSGSSSGGSSQSSTGNSSSSGGGTAYSGDTSQEKRIFEEDRLRQRSEPQKQIIEVHVKSQDSHIIDVVHDSISGYGKLNGTVLKVVTDN